MLELTAKIILIGALSGMAFIVFQKIPALRELTETGLEFSKRRGKILNLNKISLKTTSFLSKFQSKFKDLKREKKNKRKEVNFSDDYWEKIRKG